MFANHNKQVVLDNDGLATYYPKFFFNDDMQDKTSFSLLKKSIQWQQDKITLFGKTHNVPRLQAWYGDDGAEYTYSGIALKRNNWSEELFNIKSNIENSLGLSFNSCLCNLYRDGKDYVAWHSDDETQLGLNPTIASVSLGESRKIVFRHKTDKTIKKIELELDDRSLLIMEGRLQHAWSHKLTKTARKVDSRINLTFRLIK